MPLVDYDFCKGGRRRVSYFDRLGFGKFTAEHDLVEIFSEISFCLSEARRHGQDFANVEFAWFSDTFLFWSTDDSRASFCAVAEASRWFFDELIDSKVPLRGALAFGDFYGDKANGLFFGKALVDSCQCGEKYDWLGFVLHDSALKQMAEVGQPVSDLCYKRWDAESKKTKTNTVEKESVVAYLPAPGSVKPVPEVGGDPYLETVEEMASWTQCEGHRRKYENAIQFMKHFASPN
jgi:hypothetical protein